MSTNMEETTMINSLDNLPMTHISSSAMLPI